MKKTTSANELKVLLHTLLENNAEIGLWSIILVWRPKSQVAR